MQERITVYLNEKNEEDVRIAEFLSLSKPSKRKKLIIRALLELQELYSLEEPKDIESFLSNPEYARKLVRNNAHAVTAANTGKQEAKKQNPKPSETDAAEKEKQDALQKMKKIGLMA